MILPSVPTKRILPSVPTDRFLPNVPRREFCPVWRRGPKRDRNTEKNTDRNTEKNTDRNTEKNADRNTDRNTDRKWTEVCLCVFLHIKKFSVHFSVPSKTSNFQPRWDGCWRVPFWGFRSRYWGPFWGPFLGASSGANSGLCSVCFQALRNPHDEVCTESQAVCTLMMKCA